jgi:uncharacterized membrane protein YccC
MPPARRSLRSWWVGRDPGLRATKRSARAAVLVPAVFAVAEFGVGDAQTSLFAVFGSVALLLFVDFAGSMPARLRSYLGLWLTGAALITVATLCSPHAILSVAAMAVVGFAVLFAGIVSPRAVTGSTAVLLTFVLPVAEPAPASAIGHRLLGWALAGAVCIPAVLLVWTERWHDRLRLRLADAADSVADLLESLATDGAGQTGNDGARKHMGLTLGALRDQYEATPYRPTGAGITDVALTNLVSQLEWVGARARDIEPEATPAALTDSVADVLMAATGVLRLVASPIRAQASGTGADGSAALAGGAGRLRATRQVATEVALARLVEGVDPAESDASGPDVSDPTGRDPAGSVRDIDPTFAVRMLAFAVEHLADVALGALGTRRGEVPSVRRGAQTVRSYARIAAGHLTSGSVWFRNSLRGAVALAVAVAVVEATTVQHGFWVVLGTLSVLRSNALGTGSTAVRAVAGTALGFVVGSLVLAVLGHHDVFLWVVLPVAVLVAGVAPSAISFVAGQAGFTVMVVVIFNIIVPVGSSVGLLRVEDVAIGTAVSVAVGLLFWPRGATSELARALYQGFETATGWLVAAIDHVGREGPAGGGSPESTRALAAARRLDDAYRQFLAERGAKQVPLPRVTRLLTGCAAIRRSALTLERLPVLATPGAPPPIREVVVARTMVAGSCGKVERWFGDVARSLDDPSEVMPAPQPMEARLPPELTDAWSAVRRAGRREGVFAVLRLLWVEERLDDLRQLQAELAGTGSDLP